MFLFGALGLSEVRFAMLQLRLTISNLMLVRYQILMKVKKIRPRTSM